MVLGQGDVAHVGLFRTEHVVYVVLSEAIIVLFRRHLDIEHLLSSLSNESLGLVKLGVGLIHLLVKNGICISFIASKFLLLLVKLVDSIPLLSLDSDLVQVELLNWLLLSRLYALQLVRVNRLLSAEAFLGLACQNLPALRINRSRPDARQVLVGLAFDFIQCLEFAWLLTHCSELRGWVDSAVLDVEFLLLLQLGMIVHVGASHPQRTGMAE